MGVAYKYAVGKGEDDTPLVYVWTERTVDGKTKVIGKKPPEQKKKVEPCPRQQLPRGRAARSATAHAAGSSSCGPSFLGLFTSRPCGTHLHRSGRTPSIR